MKIVIIILLSLFSISLHAQTNDAYAIRFPDDNSEIDSIRKMHPVKDCRMLTYQTGYDEECISSVLLIHVDGKTKYWCFIYENIDYSVYSYSLSICEGEIENDSIFSYLDYKKTGLTKSEDFSDSIDFPPPSRESELIFYKDNDIAFFFEDNTNTGRGYIPDKERETYRQEWTKIIRNELEPIFKKYCSSSF
ncbi:MAG: hypothetical protein ACK5M3_13515 [Dysgonomonas sp.]